MKTSVKTLIASVLAAIVLSTSAFTSVAADKNINSTVITSAIAFSKVVVTGNVRVELVQSEKQSVVIVENYDKELTSVVQKGDKLFINSNEQEPINMIVYVKDLLRIDASNTATVQTRGLFSSNALQVFLKDNAKAYVNAEVETLYTVLKDNSRLKLKGSSDEHTLVKGNIAKLSMDNFASLKTTRTSLGGDVLAVDYKIEMNRDTVIADRVIR